MPEGRAISGLEALLVRMIRADGPISIARYTELCLDHPEHGYYRKAEPFGAAGDFTTAPEISQMFGEIVGLFLAQAWRDQGSPKPLRLVELGPGRATLMVDLLRTMARVPGLADALDVHLVERSPRLAGLQREKVGEHGIWRDSFDDVPAGPMLLVANEFLDALPVHQLVRRKGEWREQMIGLENGRLAFVAETPAADDLAALAPGNADEGAITEVSPQRLDLVGAIARRVVQDGGLALLIDYGGMTGGPTGDTLQAVGAHASVDPLRRPGDVDLSTQVDFGGLAEAAGTGGAAVYGPVFQGTFLRTLGIEMRAVRLMEGMEGEARQGVRRALHRLTDPSAMGEAFKVLVITSPDAPPPPGFVRHD